VRRGLTCTALRAGAGRARVEKFFVWVTECWAKARELHQLKNRKTRGCTFDIVRVNSSGSQKTAGSHVALRGTLETPGCHQ